MDWLTFISKIVESLAWPSGAVILVALLREEIAKLAPFLKKFKAGPLEAEFEREIKELKEVTHEQAKPAEVKKLDTEATNFLFQLAELHPRSAILEAWVRLEATARAVLAAKGVIAPNSAYIPAARLGDLLVRCETLNKSQVETFNELRRLRNDVAHSQGLEPTQDSASAYVDVASFILGWLEIKPNAG